MAKTRHEPFVVGWMFWGIACVTLTAPSIWVCWIIIDPEETRLIPVGAGLMLAGLGAGFISWGANAVLQWLHRRRKIEERKTSKKR